MREGLVIGIDLGTSGVRAVAMRGDRVVAGVGSSAFSGSGWRTPDAWWHAVEEALDKLLAGIDRDAVCAVAVDGTSGTMLAVDDHGRSVAPALMYNDAVEDADVIARIGAVAPAGSAAHGATSGLAKALILQKQANVARLLHQADWIAGRLLGRFDTSDENNALKTGYDPITGAWPDWLATTGLDCALLPHVERPGTGLGRVTEQVRKRFGFPDHALVVAGTTDGCASFLATGADRAGDGVTVLGSTLTLKLLSDRPVFAPEYGIYSHRINDLWLAGGASNTGGAVLAQFFSGEQLEELSGRIDPATPSGLDYYPLLRPGERFPVRDEAWPPRLAPRPDDDALFLKGMLEGIAEIECMGYARLGALGAPVLGSIRTVGGGAANDTWTSIRRRKLGVPFASVASDQAAAGTARLALIALGAAQ
ncbi:FGGY-family carbohydrate kinase [Labrenzia sp. 011]|uniref:FGGY-family carbohydrate kinase n=1 Tax=Labrenzia sp. 011 TaxID=2171494 RepID=UPI000D510746|nr:FGGY-family carbohydrate kinase [Labrenzia sp. 011]PVB62853.1 carbohydrate kinase [Labrenzia sp. 011]